ncbi:DUF1294 domain-containing protein [Marinobacterium lutimaris]|uniref:Uncharacterized membrane protein YsdA, DUF1294 family n=1 Tax=Marinobacterium lutimaris TaxID=568106 RepID=A0A1H6C6D7_9GAMM|nr:cold shock and DUF1294 domain-containing protein [Marinobacterium lutimaris]SEG68524.1 Uncharacterized membrane protein YsdA, DUF1294 family [Marinobacterium lutimaris]
MKLQGKISNWNDEKGFGFVEQNGGGERAFVHIKAFNHRNRRPVDGDVIIYELERDNKNRYQAKNIKYAGERNKSAKKKSTQTGSLFGIFMAFYFAIISLLIFIGKISLSVLGLYLLMSVVAFIAYAIDKSAAQAGRWRTKESTLHILSLLFGWPGAYFGQEILRHKSIKKEFRTVYFITVILNIAGLIWLHTDSGAIVMRHLPF